MTTLVLTSVALAALVPFPSAAQLSHGYEYSAKVQHKDSASLHIEGYTGPSGDHRTITYDYEDVIWAPGMSSSTAGFARVTVNGIEGSDYCSPDKGAFAGASCELCACGPKYVIGTGNWCEHDFVTSAVLRFERPDVVKDRVVTYTVQNDTCSCSSDPVPTTRAWGPFGPAQRAFKRRVSDAVHDQLWQNCGYLPGGHLVNVTTSESYPPTGKSGFNVELYDGSWTRPGPDGAMSQYATGSFFAPSVFVPPENNGRLMTFKGTFDGTFSVAAESNACSDAGSSRSITGSISSFRAVPVVNFTRFNLPQSCYSRATLQKCPKAPVLKSFGSTINH